MICGPPSCPTIRPAPLHHPLSLAVSAIAFAAVDTVVAVDTAVALTAVAPAGVAPVGVAPVGDTAVPADLIVVFAPPPQVLSLSSLLY